MANKLITGLDKATDGARQSPIIVQNVISGKSEQTSTQENIGGTPAPGIDWVSQTPYAIDNIVIYRYLAWKSLQNANTTIPSEGAWWTEVPISPANGIVAGPWEAGVFTYIGSAVQVNGATYYLFDGTPMPFESVDFNAEVGSVWIKDSAAGASVFTDLTDVPSSYAGNAGNFVRVKDTEDGLVFTSETVATTTATRVIWKEDTDNATNTVILQGNSLTLPMSVEIDVDDQTKEDVGVHIFLPNIVGDNNNAIVTIDLLANGAVAESGTEQVGTIPLTVDTQLNYLRPLNSAGIVTLELRITATNRNITVDNTGSAALLQSAEYKDVEVLGDQLPAFSNVSLLDYFFPLSGVLDDDFPALGEISEISTGLTGNYGTPISIGNQHVSILINTVTVGGTATITGTSLSESSGIPTAADTEIITIDTTNGQNYQSAKKWYEITSVTFSGVTGLNYDIGRIGYYDSSNLDFKIVSFRADARISGNNPDIRVRLLKVQDDGDNKFTITPIEDFGFDGTAGNGEWVDHVRIGANDRSYTMTTELAPNNSMQVIKVTDYDDYFSGGENLIRGSLNEGVILKFEGEPSGGLTNIDSITVTIGLRS